MADKFERKFQEKYLALQLEKVVDKDWILENYLNAINLGQNTLGVGVASERYFGKDVSDLTLSECAVLAAITQSPSYYNPITHPDHNKERRQKVLNNMLDQGYISQTEYDEAVADNVYDRIQVVNVESQDENINSYFVDEMTDQIVQDMIDRLGYTETQAYKALYQGGLTIESTQDPDIQNICDEEVNNLENYPTDPKVSFSAYRSSPRTAPSQITASRRCFPIIRSQTRTTASTLPARMTPAQRSSSIRWILCRTETSLWMAARRLPLPFSRRLP